jgi:hypothetical protein
MLEWMIKHVVWFCIRCAVTLVCIWTIQNIIHQEGYYIEFKLLLVSAVCLIVGVRMWMPSPEKETVGSSNRKKE